MGDVVTIGRGKKWTEDQFRKAVAESVSIAQVIRALDLAPAGGSYATVAHWIATWDLDVSHFTGQAWVGTRPERPVPGQKYTLETIFCQNSSYPTSHLLAILVRKGMRERRCERCGLTEWQGNPIPLEVDHVNGVRNDHRPENLRLLCPNCHALTPTWRGRKNRRPVSPKAPELRVVRTPRERAAHAKYVKRYREEWVAANGPCAKCGSTEGLVTAYKDPTSATMRASNIWAQSAAVREAELTKCHVICGRCYLDEQAAERRSRGFKHGTRSMYQKHGCRCDECRTWNRTQKRKERQRASLVKSESRAVEAR
jgi:hypothetical protein